MKKTMRLHNANMVKGLYDLCKDVDKHFNGLPLDMIEIGSYAGESTMIFFSLLNISTINCIDTWAGNKYTQQDISYAKQRFDEFFSGNDSVFSFQLESTHSTFEPVTGIDFVYIDADHSYEAVKKDILFWKDKCEVISGHDYDDSGKYGVKRAVDEIFGKPDKIYIDNSWIVFKKIVEKDIYTEKYF